MRLLNRSIIITGASSGIGAAAATLFGAEGARLVLAARRADRLADVAATVNAGPGEAVAVAGDIRDETFAATLVDTAQRTYGGLDAAFNNAGTLGALGPIPEMSADTWHEVIATNLSSAFYAAKHQVPAMRGRPGASLVFTSSFVGYTVGLPGMGAYAASKAGLIGLTQVLAAEHGAEGIRVNALLPGGTLTEMAGTDPAQHEAVANLHALKRMASAHEIARAALFLVSDDASFVTGSALVADGGNSIAKS